MTAVANQNKQLWEGLREEEFRATIKYKRKARNQHFQHVILQVSPQVWSKATTAGRMYIGMQRVLVFDQSPLIQCTRCLGYGHSRKACRETEDVCAHCGRDHLRADCTQWSDRDNSTPKCINCMRVRMTKVEHSAFDRSCPIRIKWDKIARSRVSYY